MHVFTLLGDPVRLRIVEILASGEHSAGLLADVIGRELQVGRATVSYHLGVLRTADFVESRTEQNRRMYRLRWNALETVDRTLLDLYEIWDRRYDWPYRSDPAASPPRCHRLAERAAQWAPLSQVDVEPFAPDDGSSDFGWDDEDEDDEDDAGAEG